MSPNVILVGFMGTGKTTVGKALAARLQFDFVDTDQMIAARAGKSIADIFTTDGEERFRELEREVVSGLRLLDQRVFSTGGGAMLDPVNRAELEKAGMTVALTASVDTILERLSRGDGVSERPLLASAGGGREGARARIEELLSSRAPFYAMARHAVPTDGKSVSEVVEEVARLWESHQKEKKRRA